MTSSSSGNAPSAQWTAKPWILPGAVFRSIVIIVVAIIIVWIEFYFGMAFKPFADVPLVLWTGLAFFVVWILSMMSLLLLRATHTYILRNDSLEIRTGIATERSHVIAPSGFSDLEVIRSISARMVNSGDIIVRLQTETESNLKMSRVRDPMKAADQIRRIMARPIVRVEGTAPPEEKKQP